jgi:hypothetical protein
LKIEMARYCTGTVPLTGIPPMLPVIVNEVIPVGTVMGI